MPSQQSSGSLRGAGSGSDGAAWFVKVWGEHTLALGDAIMGGSCSVLCGREEGGEEGQQEVRLAHTPEEETEPARFCAALCLEMEMPEGGQPCDSFLSCDRNLSATWFELRRDFYWFIQTEKLRNRGVSMCSLTWGLQ